MEHYYAMIMAGGGGTRLWPMSRSTTPKQLLPLVEDDSMFRVSVQRLAPLFPPEKVYVVTGRKYVDALRADAPEIPAQNFIVEPYGKDSGPAAALGISIIQKRDPQATIAILTADHHIARKDAFRDVLAAARDLAQKSYIVTLGISPSYPATGFGYIRQGKELEQIGDHKCYESLGFTEKPDPVTAAAFLASGDYTWNSGMFIWKASQAMDEFKRQQPDMHSAFTELSAAIDTPEFDAKLDEIWEKVTKISLDYAVMEGAQNMAVIPVDMGWSDVGSWASLFEVVQLDSSGNFFKTNIPTKVILDTENTLVYSNKLIVTVGVENLVVVETPDAILICHKDRTQDVKEVVNHLKSSGQNQFL
jgi:mannose-1-phosphate guanylyltransferase